MKDAIIITDPTFELSDFKVYAKTLFEFEEANESEIEHNVPFNHESYLSISKDNTMFDLMEPEEQRIVASEFDSFNIFSFLFYNFNHLQNLVAYIPSDRKIIIDNDHGTFMRKEDFLKLNSYEEFVKGFK